ncbi:MAG: hypothetical protein GY747_13055 [Planctomycetes bacterium]|nr:hypothetical protein [Planctomycetota bacterium]MCP4772015.1 hypothetical protein [Planctomycetota bacterium]MCP4860245.1 hypothetical protein [Planctomycetota bacterium]
MLWIQNAVRAMVSNALAPEGNSQLAIEAIGMLHAEEAFSAIGLANCLAVRLLPSKKASAIISKAIRPRMSNASDVCDSLAKRADRQNQEAAEQHDVDHTGDLYLPIRILYLGIRNPPI